MNIAIYNTVTGKIAQRMSLNPMYIESQCQENEEFYLNCPAEATHIIDNEPVTIIEEITPIVLTLEEVKTQKLAYLASERFKAETAGTTIGIATILTDRESQAQLTSALNSLREGFISTVKWKAANGFWIDVTLQDILQISTIVAQHVQATFAKECELATQVNNATTIEEVEAITWASI